MLEHLDGLRCPNCDSSEPMPIRRGRDSGEYCECPDCGHTDAPKAFFEAKAALGNPVRMTVIVVMVVAFGWAFLGGGI
ncbi:hypothetical protein [Thioalkalivibrio sp. ALgr3]|uniref:hypothetical protein n=1 Tax=Thioalkalivibrio sp. ALgr3 TaxID=1239292 RepID=UPI000376D8A7|nr:hypothetical protein [Thioalkalivibrio sp. ALgr3]